ncbi:MAG: cytochrome c biogenesis CcdA family protein [Alphaproteobacteria bacterium]
MGFDVTLWGAVLAGLLSFASPCVLPLVPPYLCFIAGVSLEELTDDDKRKSGTGRVVLSSVAFVLGFTLVFTALGATASTIGKAMADYLDILGYIAGGLIIIMGLHFLGVLRISLFNREARVHVERRPAGLGGAFLVGIAFAFGWTPCVGPALAAILFVAGAEESVAEGASLLAAYSLGIGVPFVAAAFFAGPFIALMRRMRAHLGKIEKAMGALLVATGVLFITGQMSTLAYWLLEAFPTLGQIG